MIVFFFEYAIFIVINAIVENADDIDGAILFHLKVALPVDHKLTHFSGDRIFAMYLVLIRLHQLFRLLL